MRLRSLRSVVRLLACMGIALATWSAAAQVSDYHFRPERGFYPTVRVVLPDGRTLIGGGFSPPGPGSPSYSFFIARFNADGTTDASFNGGRIAQVPIWGYYESVSAFAVQPDGKILVGGNAADPIRRGDDRCYPAFCNIYPALIRMNADGTLDRSFNGTGRLVISIGEPDLGEDCCGSLEGIQLQGDGKIVVLRGQSAIARVNADGRLDRSFVGTDQVAREIDPERYAFRYIHAGYSGSWYDPTQSGHGFALEVLPGSPQQLLAYWYTFAPQGGQSWIAALGPVDGNRAVLQGFQTVGAGARFPPNFDATNARQDSWGTLTFRFSDCNHGHVDWNSSVPGYGSGGMDLTRLTLPAGLTCSP